MMMDLALSIAFHMGDSDFGGDADFRGLDLS